MSRTCPQCGNLNGEEVKFCTACGKALESLPAQPAVAVTPQTGPVTAGPPPDQGGLPKVLVVAAIALFVIIAALVFLQVSGTYRIFPSSAPVVTSTITLTAAITPSIPVQTPVPDLTIIPAEDLTLTTPIPDLPSTSPTPAKAVFCPSDRRACGSRCIDIMTDPAHCGDCDVSCFPGQVCLAGRCMRECSSGESNCVDGCYNLSYSAENCGICGNTCPFGLICNRSVCTPPITTVIPTYAG